MLTTLLGSLFGGLFRMAPEVLKWLDRKDERKHEIAMFSNQLEADKLRGQMALNQANVGLSIEEVKALAAGVKAQAVLSGVKWVDAINTLMRPLITFWWVIVLYTGALIAQYVALIDQGFGGLDAVLKLWGTDEKAICASIISFWFVDRALRKGAGV